MSLGLSSSRWLLTFVLETESFLGRGEARTVKALTPNCSILTSTTFDKSRWQNQSESKSERDSFHLLVGRARHPIAEGVDVVQSTALAVSYFLSCAVVTAVHMCMLPVSPSF